MGKMQVRVASLIAIVLLVALMSSSMVSAKSSGDIEKRTSYLWKRSLCNTFGGCGSKRSLNQQALYNDPVNFESLLDGTTDKDFNARAKQDTNAALTGELLSDLQEYLRSNDKYKQGKFVVLVPKHYDPTSLVPIVPANIQQNAPVDLQEVQLERFYV